MTTPIEPRSSFPVRYVYVQAKIDPDIKREAAAVLKGMGLSISAVMRLFLERVALDGKLPFELLLHEKPSRKTSL